MEYSCLVLSIGEVVESKIRLEMLFPTKEKKVKEIGLSIWSGKGVLFFLGKKDIGKRGKKRNPAREFLVC